MKLKTPNKLLLFNLAAGVILAFGVLHLCAYLSIEDGLGFHPHPWFVQLPNGLTTLFDSVGLPGSNIGVAITFYYALPVYGFTALVCLFVNLKRFLNGTTEKNNEEKQRR